MSVRPTDRRATDLIVRVVEGSGALLGKTDDHWPVSVLKSGLELEIDPVLEARALAIHGVE